MLNHFSIYSRRPDLTIRSGWVRFLSLIGGAVLLFGLTAGCSALPISVTKDISASVILPNLGGYTRINTSDIQGTLANVSAGGVALTGNLEISAMIKLLDGLATCYHNAGAFDSAVYYNTSNPLLAGAMLVINDSVISNPSVLISCLHPATGAASVQDVQVCTRHYQLIKNGSTYEVLVAAADPSVCALFLGAIQAQGQVTQQ